MGSASGDTIAGNATTTASLVVPTSGRGGAGRFNGFVNSPTDQDWIRVDLMAGELYRFTADDTSGPFTPTLALRSASGALIVEDVSPRGGITFTYRPTTSGKFYLDVGGVGSGAGGYEVTAFEVPGTKTTFATLAVGASTTGNIQSAADQDWFKVELVAGQSYIFDVSGITFSDTTLALRDAAGNQIVFDDDGGPGAASRIIYTATASGTFFLDAGGYAANIGNYRVAARNDDVADDTDSNATISIGETRAGRVESGVDRDWFKVSLVSGQTYQFDVQPTAYSDFEASLYDSTLNLRATDGTIIIADDDGGPGAGAQPARIVFTATTTGTYFLDVGAYSDADIGSYVLSARLEDVPDTTASNVELRVAPQSQFGNWYEDYSRFSSATDRDVFRLSLEGGNGYVLRWVEDNNTPDLQLSLTLKNASGTVIASWATSERAFSIAQNGTYFLEVAKTAGTGNEYGLSIRVDDFVDFDGNTATLNPGGAGRAGQIGHDRDTDRFSAPLVSGQDYRLLVTTAIAAEDIRLFAPGANGFGPELTFGANTSGVQDFGVIEADANGDARGNYSIFLQNYDVAASMLTEEILGAFLDLGRFGIGTATDRDWFRVSLNAGTTYIFDTILGTLDDTTLHLRNSSGVSLAFDDDTGIGAASRIEFTATSTGTYFLDVGGFNGKTGGYTIQSRKDEVADDISTSDVIAVGGSRTAQMDWAGDIDYFKISLVAGQSYTFSVQTPGPNQFVRLQLLDQSGQQIGPLVDEDELLTYTATATATYFLTVADQSGDTGAYTLFA